MEGRKFTVNGKNHKVMTAGQRDIVWFWLFSTIIALKDKGILTMPEMTEEANLKVTADWDSFVAYVRTLETTLMES